MKQEGHKTKRILICEDTDDIRLMLKKVLSQEGYQVEVSTTGEECLDMYSSKFDLVVLDVNLPGIDGIEVFKKLRKINAFVSVIIITAFSSVNQAVDAIKLGAHNYLAKPFPNSSLLAAVKDSLERDPLHISQTTKLNEFFFTSKSAQMQSSIERLKRASKTNANVILLGESGTGKELMAKYVHQNSLRQNGPFVAVDCPAIPISLFESEMFGHTAGAFTGAKAAKVGRFERAHKGTIFFDEVADLSLEAQAKLLRTIQEKEFEPLGSTKIKSVDIRIVCATSKNFTREIEEGRFRSDLYYRLAEFEIMLLPLRERTEDIPDLVEYFSSAFCNENGRKIIKFSNDAIDSFKEYVWPGNIRELRSMVSRLLILSPEDCSRIELIPPEFLMGELRTNQVLLTKKTTQTIPFEQERDRSERGSLDISQVELDLVKQALKESNNNISKAAKLLNMGRTTLYRKMKKLKLPRGE